MLTSVGKKQINAAIVILGSMPLPISSTRIGALATTGMVLIITAIGKNASCIALLWTNTVASKIATKLPNMNPPTASIAVGITFCHRTGHLLIIVATTSCGDGAMNGLTSSPATTAHHRKTSPNRPSTGSVRRRHCSRCFAEKYARAAGSSIPACGLAVIASGIFISSSPERGADTPPERRNRPSRECRAFASGAALRE